MAITTQVGTARIQKTFVGPYGPYLVSSESLTFLDNSVFVNDSPRDTFLVGLSRIQRTEQKPLPGLARIQRTEPKNLFGITRIQRTEHSDLVGVSRIQQRRLKLLTGLTRIERTELAQITGISMIRYIEFIPGVTRVTYGTATILAAPKRTVIPVPTENIAGTSIPAVNSRGTSIPTENNGKVSLV